MKKTFLLIACLLGLCLAHAQSYEISRDSLQRRFTAMASSSDAQVQAQLKKELYTLIKSKDEGAMTLAMKCFDQLKMRGVADSLADAIRKAFPRGDLAKTFEVNAVYEEKNPAKKELIFQAFLKKFPPKKFTNKIVYDYARFSIASAYVEKGNSAKAMEYADKLETNWKGEGYAAISNAFKRSGDLENAGKLLQKAISYTEAIRKNNSQNNGNNNFGFDYFNYCGMYGEILYKQKKYDESLSYLEKKKDGRALTPSESQIYVNLLSSFGRNLEALLCLNDFIIENQGTSSDYSMLKELYVKLNGSDSGYNNLLSAIKKAQTEKINQKLAKEVISEPAPLFTAKDVDGNTISLADLKGKIVILDFWATWCGPCKRSFPAMQMAVNKYKNDPDVKFLFIHTWEKVSNPTQDAIDYLKKNNYSFHLIMDTLDPVTKANNIVTAYKVSGIPAKFIIDKAGNIRYQVTGFSGGNEAAVEEISAMIESIRK